MWRPLAASIVFVAGVAALVTHASPGAESTTTATVRYYLALGDSIAYGVQPAKVRAGLPPSRFDTGYVDVLAARLRVRTPNLRVINFRLPRRVDRDFCQRRLSVAR